MMEGSTVLKDLLEKNKGVRIGVIIKGSPDPDSIASGWAIGNFAEFLGCEYKMYHEEPVSHTSNKTMINVLGIQMERIDFKDLDSMVDKYLVVDFNDPVMHGIAYEKCILHIDHHKEPKDKEKKSNGKKPFEQIIELDVGSCSTIITKLLNAEGFFESEHASVAGIATALAYGVKSDTDNLDNGFTKDWDAMKVLSAYYNKDALKRITSQRITPQTAEVLKKALSTEKVEQNWLYAGVGFLQESYRDSLASVADELMRRSGIDCVLLYAIIEKGNEYMVDASVRTSDSGLDLDDFTKKFSQLSGGRKYKGGFQIPLHFWSSCPDKRLLEEFVSSTIEGKFMQIVKTSSTRGDTK